MSLKIRNEKSESIRPVPSFDDQALRILYRALKSHYGLAVGTPEPLQTKATLEACIPLDDALSCLKVEPSRTNPAGEVWIIKKEQNDVEV